MKRLGVTVALLTLAGLAFVAGALYSGADLPGWLPLTLAQGVVTFLGAAMIAVLTRALTFEDARRLATESFRAAVRLQERERVRDELSRARALEREMVTNAASTHSRLSGGGLASLSRSAWEQARGLELPIDVEAHVTLAYEEADLYNACVSMSRTFGVQDPNLGQLIGAVMRPADVKAAFEEAIAKLREARILEALSERSDALADDRIATSIATFARRGGPSQ